MVNGTRSLGGFTRTSGAQVVVDPSGRAFAGLNVSLRGQLFTPAPGAFGGRAGRSAAIQQQAQAQATASRRQADLERARILLTKAQEKLLRPEERAELERITAPSLTRAQLAKPGAALSRVQQLRERERRQLQASTNQVLSDQEKLDIRRRELEGRFRVLQRLSNAGALLPGVATVFNNQAVALRKDQESLIKKSETTQKKIIKFEKKEEKTTGIVPRSSTQLFQTGLVTQLQKERALKEQIQRPVGIIDVRESILETEQIGRQLGARFIGPTPTAFGARTGAIAGRVLGTVEGVTRLAVDRPLFLAERFIGRPLSFELGGTIGRDILIARRIPILRELTGAGKAKEVRRGVAQFGRPSLREFGESLAFFLGPEAVVGGLRAAGRARIPLQTGLARFIGPRARPTLKFEAPLPRPPSQAEIEVSRILRRRPKTITQIREQFAAVQKKASQEELTRLIGKGIKGPGRPPRKLVIKPGRPTTTGEIFGKIDLPKPKVIIPRKSVEAIRFFTPVKKPKVTIKFKKKGVKEEITLRFPKLGEKGEFRGFQGVAERLKQLQKKRRRKPIFEEVEEEFLFREGFDVPKLKFVEPIKIPRPTLKRFRVVQFRDVLKQFQEPKIAFKTKDLFGVRSATLTFTTAGAREAEELATRTLTRQRTSELTQEFQRARQRDFTRETDRLLGRTLSQPRTRQRQRTRELERTRLRLRTIGLTLTQPLDITTPRIRTRPRPPKTPRTPFVPIGFPEIPVPEEIFPGPTKVQGFFAMVKARPFKKRKFVKVSKALSMEAALQRGLRVADVTIAQSVRLVKSKKKVKRTFPSADRRFKFRKKRNVFIERRRFAIDTITEKQDLSVAKFLSQEKKRGLSFFGVQPRKSKRRKSK